MGMMKTRVDGRAMERLYSFYSPFYDYTFGMLLSPGRKKALRLLEKRPGQRVLEIGIGPGSTLGLYPYDANIVGIDISEKMIARAQTKAQKLRNGREISLHVMDAGKLEFADASFDAVVSSYVITVVPDPMRVCGEMHRVCKPGGQIIIVNHTRSGNGFRSKLEDVFSPLFLRLGFVTDLDVLGVVRRSGIQIEGIFDCFPLRLHKVIVGRK
jgi:phosphatidylethanolamine/phosphatidyl-N-methylethanolamine N-methyltransferase